MVHLRVEHNNMNTKQVIIIRKDLKMRRGKEISQCSHASMAFLTRNVEYSGRLGHIDINLQDHAAEVTHWLENSFRKIVCVVNSEEELRELHQKALEAGLLSHLITDNGATEFNNIQTMTSLAIGPSWDHMFDGITDHLTLY